jgi:uncharacterized protein (DUF1499 family)
MGNGRRRIMAMAILWATTSACAAEGPGELGATDKTLTPCPASPNCVSSQDADEGHRIAPLSFSGDPDAAFARLLQLLRQRRDTTILEASDSSLRLELRTTFFVDDAEFLLDRQQKVIHLRSASRLGYWDLGKNRRRLEEIRSAFTETGKTP